MPPRYEINTSDDLKATFRYLKFLMQCRLVKPPCVFPFLGKIKIGAIKNA